MFYNKVAVSHRSGTGIILLNNLKRFREWVRAQLVICFIFYSLQCIKMFTWAKIAERYKLSLDIYRANVVYSWNDTISRCSFFCLLTFQINILKHFVYHLFHISDTKRDKSTHTLEMFVCQSTPTPIWTSMAVNMWTSTKVRYLLMLIVICHASQEIFLISFTMRNQERNIALMLLYHLYTWTLIIWHLIKWPVYLPNINWPRNRLYIG